MNLDDLYPHLGGEHRATEKELKVRIPLQQHIQLHTMKVLHGQSISATVKVALARYFEAFDAERQLEAQRRRLEAWAEPQAAESGPSTPP